MNIDNFSHKGKALGFIPKILFVSPKHLFSMYQEVIDECSGVEILLVEDTREEILKNIKGCNGLVGCPRHLFTKEILETAEGTLFWMHNGGAGVEQFMTPELKNSQIILTNGKIIQGPSCADHALALLLTQSRRISHNIRNQEEIPRPIELRGKTAVIIGLGGIGMCIAERASAFGMNIIGVNGDYVPMLKMIDELVSPAELLDVLPKADVVFMAAPHTHDTENILSTKEFSAMTKKPYVINISRGKTIDTDAIVKALETGQISGAGLDVTEPEPLDKDHPLRKMNNVVITPHIAGPSDWNRQRSMVVIKENIKRLVEGRPFINIVDKNLGY